MTVAQHIFTYFITLVVFVGIDSIWLARVAPNMYKRHIGHLLASRPNYAAALLFYLLFAAGLLIFVILPAVNDSSLAHALVYGGLFGLFTYATFDLTSQAVFAKWPTLVTAIDMLWGFIVSMAVSGVSYGIVHAWIK